jgi:hypothetical protein
MNQAQYAAHRGVAKSYITKLKAEGRLVFTPAGLIDVAASDALIAQTAEPNRTDAVERHAAARNAKTAPDPAAAPDAIGSGLQAARSVKERYLALQAKLDYERDIATLRDAREVEAITVSAITELRVRMEQIADTTAPELAAMQDEAAIRALLRTEIRHALEAAAHHFRTLAAKP